MREPHLDALTLAARLFEGFGADPRPRDISGALIGAAGDPAKRSFRTPPGFERARGAIPRASEVEERGSVVYDSPARRQGLPRRTGIGVGGLVIAEVLPREGTILALGLVEDRYVRRDLLLLDQPVERRRRAVGRVAGEPLWLEAEPALSSSVRPPPRPGGSHVTPRDRRSRPPAHQ